MKTKTRKLEDFLGIMTHIDPSLLPWGAAVSSKGLAQYSTGKIQRIAGITVVGDAKVDGSVRIPFTKFARGLTDNPVIAVYKGAAATKMVNLTADAEITGTTTLASTDLGVWTHTFYAQKHIVAGGGNVLQHINAATTRIDLVGTNVPVGSLVASYLDRLYVSGIASEEGIVRYSGVLDTTFDASALVNVKELPGPVTALAINSPTTATEGVGTDLVICKETGVWLWNESKKVNISASVGTKSPNTFASTPVGTFFLGRKGGIKPSVFFLRVGTAGEPVDVGIALSGALAGIVNEEVACAVYHDGFYKLFFSKSGLTNEYELWLDVDAFIETEKIIWYGVHERGGADSVTTTDTSLDFSKKAAASANAWFRESSSLTSDFLDANGLRMVATLDLPLNVEEIVAEKSYEIVQMIVDPSTNVNANELVTGIVNADGLDKGGQDIPLYDESRTGALPVIIPIRAQGTTGLIAQSVELILYHDLNKPFSILELVVQYAMHEEEQAKIRSRARA